MMLAGHYAPGNRSANTWATFNSLPETRTIMNAASPLTLPIRALIAPVTPLQQNCTIVWCIKTMKAVITQKLWPLGDDVRFVCGHGPMSSFGQERRTNPFVSDQVLAGE